MLWQEQYRIGHEVIDAQHEDLFNHLETLITSAAKGNAAELEELYDYLHNYVRDHFRDEEAFMEMTHFPHLEAHRAMHNEFRQTLDKLHAEYKASQDPDLALQTLTDIISNWLVSHILGEDVQIGAAFRSRRVAGSMR